MKLSSLSHAIRLEIFNRINISGTATRYQKPNSSTTRNLTITKVGMIASSLLLASIPDMANAVTPDACIAPDCVVVTNTAELNTALNNTGTATRVVLANDITLNADVQVRMIESNRRNITIDGNGNSLRTGTFDFNIAGTTSTVWGSDIGLFKFENINELTSSTAGDQSVIRVGQLTGVNVEFDNIQRFTDSMYAVMGQLGDNANGNRIAEVIFGNIATMDKFTYGVGHQITQGGPLRFKGDFSIYTDGAPGTYNTVFWSNTPNLYNIMTFEPTANLSAQVTKFTLGSSANNDAYQYIMADGARFQLFTPQNVFGQVNNGLRLGSYDAITGFGSGVQLDLASYDGSAVVGHGISNLGGDVSGGMGNGATTAGDVIFNIGSGSTLRYSGANNAGIFVQKNSGVGGDVFIRSDAVLNATNANGIIANMNGIGQLYILNDVNAIINAQNGIGLTSTGAGDAFNIDNLGVINSTVDGISINTTQPRLTNLTMTGGVINALQGDGIAISGQSDVNITDGTINLSAGTTGLNLASSGSIIARNLVINNNDSTSTTIVKSAANLLQLIDATINATGSAQGLSNLNNLILNDVTINVAGNAAGINTGTTSLDTWTIDNLQINVSENGTGIVLNSGISLDKNIIINLQENTLGSGIKLVDGASSTTTISNAIDINSVNNTALDISGTTDKQLILQANISGNVDVTNSGNTTFDLFSDLQGNINKAVAGVFNFTIHDGSSYNGNMNLSNGDNNVTIQAGSNSTGSVNGSNTADQVVLENNAVSNLALSLSEGNNLVNLGQNSQLNGALTAGAGNDQLIINNAAIMNGLVNLGDGNNTLTLGLMANLNNALTTGIGVDTLSLGSQATITGGVNLGAGDNVLTLAENALIDGTVVMGGGSDQVTLSTGSMITDLLDLGNGNNVIDATGQFVLNGSVKTGSGNDTFTLKAVNSNTKFTQIDGGTGTNTFNLTDNSTLNLSEVGKIININFANLTNGSILELGQLNNLSNAQIDIDDTSKLHILQSAQGQLQSTLSGQGTASVDGMLTIAQDNLGFEGDWVIGQLGSINMLTSNSLGAQDLATVHNEGRIELNNLDTFNYQLTGNGLVNINKTLVGTAGFSFGDRVGSNFTGTVNLENTRFDLSLNSNQSALNQANLVIGQNSFGLVGQDSTIGDLTLSGGELDFVFSSPTVSPVLSVNVLDLTTSLSRIDLAGNVNLDTSQIPTNPQVGNFLDQDSLVGNNGILLISADQVLEAGKQLTLTINGGATGTQVSFTGLSDGVNQDIGAVYDYVAVTSEQGSANNGPGIYVDYLLKQLTTNTNIIFNNTNSVSDSIDAMITGMGGIEIQAANNRPISLTNNANNYTGITHLSSGKLILEGDSVLGNTSELRLASNTEVDTNGSNVALGGLTGAGQLTLNGGSVTLKNGSLGDIYSGQLSGTTGELILSGGTLALTGNNSFTGNTTVLTDAILNIGAGLDTGSYAGNILNNGKVIFESTQNQNYNGVISGSGSLETATTNLTFNKAQTYTGNTSILAGGLVLTENGDLAGNVINNGTLIFDRATALNFDNYISGTGGIELFGAGAITLSNQNDHQGTTQISQGKLILTNAKAAGTGNIVNNGSLDLTFSDQGLANTLSGSGTINVNGQGIALTANNIGFSGGLNIGSDASLDVTNLNQIGVGQINLLGNLNYLASQSSVFSNQLVGQGSLNVNLTDKANTLTFSPANLGEFTGTVALENATIDLDDALNRNGLANSTLLLGQNSLATSTVDQSAIGNLAFRGGELEVEMISPTAANVLKVKNLSIGQTETGGSGRLNLTNIQLGAPEGISGNRLLDQNTLDISSGFLVVEADQVLTPGQFLDLYIEGVATQPTTADITDDSGNTVNATYNYIAVAADETTDPSLNTNGLYVTYQLTRLQSLSNLVIDSAGANFSVLTAQLTGTGDVTLKGNTITPIIINNDTNDYTGATVISAGGVALASNNGLGNTNNLNIAAGANFNLNTFNQTVGGLNGAGALDIGQGQLTINTTDSSFTGTITGQQAGIFNLETGALALTGNNTFVGQTLVGQNATLTIGAGGTTGSYAGDISNNGTLMFDRTDTLLYDNVISGSGALVQNGMGTLILSKDQGYTGLTTIQNGTLQLGQGGTTGSVMGDILNQGTLAINRSDAMTVGNLITGSGGITQQGMGLVTLNNPNNSFTGGINIMAGSGGVDLTRANAAGTGQINNNALLLLSYDNEDFSQSLTGNGLTQINGDQIGITGINSTYTGGWDIAGNANFAASNSQQSLGTGAVKVGGTLTVNVLDNTDQFNFTNVINGTGLVDVYGGTNANGQMTQFNLASGKAQNFRGTLGLTDTQFILDNENAAGIRNANLQLNSGANLINTTYKAIGDLTLNGGTFSTRLASSTEAFLLTVNNLNLGADAALGGLDIGNVDLGTLDLETNLANQSFLDQDSANADAIQLILAQNVSQDGVILDLLINGQPVTSNVLTNQADGFGNVDIDAKYEFAAVTSRSAGDTNSAGLFLDYVLKSLTTNTNLVLSTQNSINKTFGALVTGSGSLELRGDDGTFVISNANNDYAGNTLITAGQVQLGADQSLGDQGVLAISGGATLNFDGHTQDVNRLSIAAGSQLDLGGGQMNYFGGTIAADNPLDNGILGQIIGDGSINLLNGELAIMSRNDNLQANIDIAAGAQLTLSEQGTVGTGKLTIGADGRLLLSQAETEVANQLFGTGHVDLMDSRLTLTGNNEAFAGQFNIDTNSHLIVMKTGNLGTAKILNDGQLDFNLLGMNNQIDNLISGTGKINQLGTGLLTLGNIGNSFTGGIDIQSNSGGVKLINASAAGTGVINNNASLEIAYNNGVFANNLTGTGLTRLTGEMVEITGNNLAYAGNWDILGSGILNTNEMKQNLGVGSVNIAQTGELRVNILDEVMEFDVGSRLTGNGLLDIYGGTNTDGSLTKLQFAAGNIGGFAGTIGLTDAQLVLDTANANAIGLANLQINQGASLVNNSNQTIGDLTLNGGVFNTSLANGTEAYLLSVNKLMLGANADGGNVDLGNVDLNTLNLNSNLANKSFLDQDSVDADAIQLIAAKTVSQDGLMLDLLINGQAVASTVLTDQADGFGNQDIEAEYGFSAVFSQAAGPNNTAGLFVDYVLKSLTTNTNLVLSTQNSTNKSFGALIKGAGSLELRGDNGVLEIANSKNDYQGNTLITSGTVKLGANQSLGDKEVLSISNGATLDLAGMVQDINRLSIEKGSMLDVNGGTLNYVGGAISTGNLLDKGIYGTLSGKGTINIQAGEFVVNSINDELQANINIQDDASIVLNQTSNLGSGILDISEKGSLFLNKAVSLISNSLTGTGSIYLNDSQVTLLGNSKQFAGTLNVNESSRLTITDMQNLGQSVINNLGNVDFNLAKNLDQILNAKIKGIGQINKLGDGILRITSDYSNIGPFNVQKGHLLLDDKVAMINDLTIMDGAYAGGFGTIKGNVKNEGMLVVGDASMLSKSTQQTLNIQGDLMNYNVVSLAGTKVGNTLNVAGNYSARSDLIFNVVLEGDQSLTDKLNVKGDTAGKTTVFVKNIGGRGAQTDKGIELIRVDGNSEGVFSLASRVIAGSYDYELMQVGKNWYLQSNLLAIRPEIGAYLANIDIANATSVMRYQDRINESMVPQSEGGTALSENGRVWGRIAGGITDSRAANEIDQKFYQSYVQLGGDMFNFEHEANQTRLIVGTMGAIGQSHSSNTNQISGYVANTSQDSYKLGLYSALLYNGASTHQQAYVDTWIQHGWYNNEVRGQDLIGSERYDATNFAASLELGYPITLHETTQSFIDFIPQGQLIYKNHKADDFTESNGTRIKHPETNGIESRLGAQINYQYRTDSNLLMKTYVGANWIHDDTNAMVELNEVRYHSDRPNDIFDAKLGLALDYDSRFSSFVEINTQQGSNRFSELSGSVGLSYQF